MGQLKETGLAAFLCAGKCPGNIAKKLAFQQGIGNGGAVDRHKGAEAAGAGVVDALGQHLLSGAALSDEKDIGVGAAVFFCGLYNRGHGRRGPDHIGEGELCHKALLMELLADITFQPLDLIDQLDVHNGP